MKVQSFTRRFPTCHCLVVREEFSIATLVLQCRRGSDHPCGHVTATVSLYIPPRRERAMSHVGRIPTDIAKCSQGAESAP